MNGLYGDIAGLAATTNPSSGPFTTGTSRGAAWGTPLALPDHLKNIMGGISGLNPQRDAIAQTLTTQQMGTQTPPTPPTAAASAPTPAPAAPGMAAAPASNVNNILSGLAGAAPATPSTPASTEAPPSFTPGTAAAPTSNVNNILSGLAGFGGSQQHNLDPMGGGAGK